MKIIDANEFPPGTAVEADICVVGSGPAGMTVALQLDAGDQTVALIESGDYGPDEVTQALCDIEVVGYPVGRNSCRGRDTSVALPTSGPAEPCG